MALIGSFPASSAAVFNLDFLPQYVLVNSTGSGNQSLTNLSVVTSGEQLMSVTDVDRITALAKYDAGACLDYPQAGVSDSLVASYIVLSAGRINKATTIRGTNGNAAARDFYAASTNISNVARRAIEQSINASANATFDNFEALFFLPANVIRAQVTFANGYSDEFTPNELSALYAKYHVAETSGHLQGHICIDADSGAGLISQVVLYNGSGGNTVVLKTDYVQM